MSSVRTTEFSVRNESTVVRFHYARLEFYNVAVLILEYVLEVSTEITLLAKRSLGKTKLRHFRENLQLATV